jgi:hypothetical protein
MAEEFITLEEINNAITRVKTELQELLTAKSVVLKYGKPKDTKSGNTPKASPARKESTTTGDNLDQRNRYFREAGELINLVQYLDKHPEGADHALAAKAAGTDLTTARKTYHRLKDKGLVDRKGELWLLTEKGLHIWKTSLMYGKGKLSE